MKIFRCVDGQNVVACTDASAYYKHSITLESGIDVGQGINVGPGKLGKKNKRRALNTHVLCSE